MAKNNVNTPSIKPQTFVPTGNYRRTFGEIDLFFGKTSRIKIPVKCKRTKCSFQEGGNLSRNLFLIGKNLIVKLITQEHTLTHEAYQECPKLLTVLFEV